MMGENVLPIKERIYIGGLDPPRLSPTDVLRRLKAVKGIEIESATCCNNNKDNGDDDDDDSDDDSYINGNDNKPYLHVTAISKDEDLTALSIITKQYHNVKWKGCKLVVEAAKPHFLERLREERKVRDEALALATSTAIESTTVVSEDGVIMTEEIQEQQLSNNTAAATTTTKTTGLIPRRLKVRKKHGHAAFHVDTQPWSVDNWFFFNKARDKLEDRVEKYHIDTIINNKRPPHARLVAKPLMHRAVHIRFQDKVKSVSQNINPKNNNNSGTDDITSHEVKKNADNESSSIISSSDSDSDSDGDSSIEHDEKERENLLQEVSVSMNVKEKEVIVDKYHWSSSEDESSDDDDDEEEYSNFRPPLGNNRLLSSVEISGTDEFAAGFDDASSVDENSEDGQLEDTESSDNYDQSGDSNIESGLTGDVSSNLNILSSIFPDMAVDAKPVNPSSEHDPNLDNTNITSSTNRNKSVPNGIMPRFDPNAKSSKQYIVEKLPTEQDGSDISPTNESSSKNNSEDDASVEDDCDDDNVTGEKLKNPAENEVDTTPALTQDGVYDQDKLENVFRDARDGWEGQDTRTTLVNNTSTSTNPDSSSGTSAFSFGFNLSDNDKANKQKVIEKKPTKDDTFSFSFDVPVSVPVQAHVGSTTINIPTGKEKDLEYTNVSISSRAERDATDDDKNIDGDTVVAPRRRGINLPEQDLQRYVDNFFGCNNGLNIMRNVDGFKNDDRERAEWNRERQSLTLDWKRKRKYAINRIQKRMKTKRR